MFPIENKITKDCNIDSLINSWVEKFLIDKLLKLYL